MTPIRSVSVCLFLMVVSAFAATPEQASPSKTAVLQPALPGIDRGLRSEIPRNVARTAGLRKTPPGPRALPDRVLVRFRSGRDLSVRELRDAGVRAREIRAPEHADYHIVMLDEGDDPEREADALRARDDVEYAQADYRVYPRLKPNDPLYFHQWNMPAINLERGWDINPGATASVVVAVLDTGVAFEDNVFRYKASAITIDGQSFPALGTLDVRFAAAPDIIKAGRVVAPHDFIWNDADPVDLDGHGTHVSGTIGELTGNGVGVAGIAYNARLMPVKVLSTDWDDIFDSPEVGTDDTVARGIRYAADNGAQIINMSLGRTGPAAPVVEAAVRYAVSKGAFIAIAGGNDGDAGNPVEVLAEIASRVAGAVSVGAVGPDLKHASYSTSAGYMEISAPGGNFAVREPDGGILQQTVDLDLALTFLDGPVRYRAPRFDAFAYFYFEGTSMATAHVSGVAALLHEQGITNPAAIEAALERFATDLGAAGRDDQYGAGLIDARATLRGLGLAR
jgi:serine protease